MAIYTTLFLCTREQLVIGFADWRLPMPKPVCREIKNPFTGLPSTIETREPDWPDDVENAFAPEYQVVAIAGNYEDYLESRLRPFVRANRHWATKGLTEVEVILVAQVIGVNPSFEYPLFAPPSSGATLQEFPQEMLSQLARLDEGSLERAAEMLTLYSAKEILKPITELARQATDGQRLYLLTEA